MWAAGGHALRVPGNPASGLSSLLSGQQYITSRSCLWQSSVWSLPWTKLFQLPYAAGYTDFKPRPKRNLSSLRFFFQVACHWDWGPYRKVFLCSDKPNRAVPRPLEPDYPTNVKEFRASVRKPRDAVNGVTSCMVGERRKRMQQTWSCEHPSCSWGFRRGQPISNYARHHSCDILAK